MTSPLTNRSILVTGATGSFGNAFVRHALACGARRVAIFSRDELKQSEMRAALKNDDRLRFFIGSVIDADRVDRAARGCDLLVHAAALKQIDTCDKNRWEACSTNTDGSRVVAEAAITAGVERAVFLSTDKASAPETHYGVTKLAAESLWIGSNAYAAGTRTRLAVTRYGNVISSRGSVIPLFQDQARTGRLTITDRHMSRFWMSLADAVSLVELALGQSRGGDVFIPRVASAGILTVAEAVAPGVPWVETGIRGDEKLHEMLISEVEARRCYDYGSHFRLEPADRSWEYLPPPSAEKVPDGFCYRSDTNPDQLSVEQMRALIDGDKKRVAA